MRSNQTLRPFQRLFGLLRTDRRDIFYLYLFALVRGVIMLSLPLGIQAIINLIGGGQVATSWGVLIGFVTIGIFFTGVLQVMELTVSEFLKQRIFARSALEFAYRMPRISNSATQGRYLPELVNRFFDTLTIQKGLNKVLIDVPVSSLQILLGLILLAFYHPFFIGFGFFLILLLYLIFRFTGQNGMRTSLLESKYKYMTAHWLEELGRSNSTFKLAGTTTLPLAKADDLATKYVKARSSHFRVLLGHYWAMVGFKTIVTLALLVLGGILVFTERMNIGQFVAAEIIIIILLGSVEKVILGLESIYDVLTALEKLGEVTDIPLEQQDGLSVPASMDHGPAMAVELRNVTFNSHWSGNPILRDVSVSIAPGEKVFLTGTNGSGKSVLLGIVAGMIEPNEGNVLIDGQGIRSLCPKQMRSAMGDSFSHEDIFSGTVLDNIVMGRPWVSADDVRNAAERTGLMRMLVDLPEGLLTSLDGLGARLPQSLMKRIILARCIAGKPRLVLYEDDAHPHLVEDHDLLLDLLTGEKADFTLIAVGHDPRLRDRCSRKLKLERGLLLEDHDLGNDR
ncbi:MAG: ATP-binding cassette domain-containing protein [Flavobacteriales bacterium]|nr:ATP-binding cassette domain-containing protein [Flavobacteriales bacterium]